MILKGKKYLSHRLTWLYIYGYMSTKDIDHINGNPSDNRIINLRECNDSENQQNLKKATNRNKSSGLLGVSFDYYQQKYHASIRINGKTKHLGYFNDKYDAHNAYLKEKRQLHPFGTI